MPAEPGRPLPCRGRFAPSPTGPLHFGSLVAAVASYLQASANGGDWLVRIEDIDPQREAPGATSEILDCLLRHGFEFDEPWQQSDHLEHYDRVIAELLDAGLAFPCACSRRDLTETAHAGRAGLIYPGTCRQGTGGRPAKAVRLRAADAVIAFQDGLQGPQNCRLGEEIGDFLIRRGDGLVAYQLAVTVDDHRQGITQVVRGADLLDTTFMQIRLQQLLGYATPQYMHVPVVLGASGEKLSKQTGAPGVDASTPVKNIFQCLVFLRQTPPASLLGADLETVWDWARAHWCPDPLRGISTAADIRV